MLDKAKLKFIGQELNDHREGIGVNIVDLFSHIQAIQEENERLEKERYLPIVCSNCGRMRICYLPGEHETWCDKCYTDFSKIAPPDR